MMRPRLLADVAVDQEHQRHRLGDRARQRGADAGRDAWRRAWEGSPRQGNESVIGLSPSAEVGALDAPRTTAATASSATSSSSG